MRARPNPLPRIIRKQKPPPGTTRFKRYLRIDFQFCCAYCHIHEGFLRVSDFGVEHFRPKAAFKNLKYRYSNLLYACNDCNRIKREIWPNREEKLVGFRFLNPCFDHFEEHLEISEATGLATPKTPAGRYFVAHLQ
jgi:HNH endonuclease